MIRLLLADDEHLIRSALAALLGMEDDLEVIAQAASGPEAIEMARLRHPDVAVDLQDYRYRRVARACRIYHAQLGQATGISVVLLVRNTVSAAGPHLGWFGDVRGSGLRPRRTRGRREGVF